MPSQDAQIFTWLVSPRLKAARFTASAQGLKPNSKFTLNPTAEAVGFHINPAALGITVMNVLILKEMNAVFFKSIGFAA